ncbi:MAG: DMT family transporter [Candidatus Paracaedibacteraceae bacterium]|nr:DMT family transporter [Candidatus Paracaedibacteraceae bacterium]
MSNTDTPNSTPWLGPLFMAVGVFFFVSVNALIKALDHKAPSEQILLFRFAFATIPCLIFTVSQKKLLLLNLKLIKAHTIRGFLGAISLFMLFESIRLLPLSEAVTISFISALFVTLFATLFLKEHCSAKQWLYIALGFCGVVLIAKPDGTSLKLGILFGLGSAAIEGGMIIHTRFLSRTLHPIQIAFYYAVFAALLCLPFAYQVWQSLTITDFSLLALVGIGGGIGQIFIFKAAQFAPGNRLAPMIYTQIIWSLIFDRVLFHTDISTTAYAGIGLIVLSGLASTREHNTSSQK